MINGSGLRSHFDDLPVTRLTHQVRIGLDLMGAGTVDVDAVLKSSIAGLMSDAKAINQRLASSGLLLANPLTFESSRFCSAVIGCDFWMNIFESNPQPKWRQVMAFQKRPRSLEIPRRKATPAARFQISGGRPADLDRGLFRRLRRNNRRRHSGFMNPTSLTRETTR